MFNREYDGGSDDKSVLQDKIYVGGAPVEYILPFLKTQNGGSSSGKSVVGPFENKVVPAGLVLISPPKDVHSDYENLFYPGERREVVPESLYDILTGAAFKESHSMSKTRHSTPPKHRQNKRRSIKQKRIDE